VARFEKKDTEAKFWEITLKGRVVSQRTGKIRTMLPRVADGEIQHYDRVGRTADHEHPDDDSAEREYEQLVAAKRSEGFKLVAGTAPPGVIEMHVNADLEAAIRAAPDDLDAYLVYGDWLLAHGDLRGELVALQHRMQTQPDRELARRADQLVSGFLASWLGDIAGRALHRVKLSWRTGFVIAARIDGPANATEVALHTLVAEVLASPIARFVRELTLRGSPRDVADAIPEAAPPLLATLRLLYNITYYGAGSPEDRRRLEAHRHALAATGIRVEVGTYVPEDR